MKEFRVTLRVHNNLLVERREELGMSQGQLAASAGMHIATINTMECLRYSPLDGKGDWKPSARRVAEFHGLPPDELWPQAIRNVTEPTQTRAFDSGELRNLLVASTSRLLTASPEELAGADEEVELVRKAVKTLEPREEWVLRRQFGIFDDEQAPRTSMSRQLGVCPQRVSQISAHALRRLRNPCRLGMIESLPREKPDPVEQYKYPPWTPREAEHAKRGEAMSKAEREYWKAKEEQEQRADEAREKRSRKRDMNVGWLEFAVEPLAMAHAFFTHRNPSGQLCLVDGQVSYCGEMAFYKDQSRNERGFALHVSERECCPRCVAAMEDSQGHGG